VTFIETCWFAPASAALFTVTVSRLCAFTGWLTVFGAAPPWK